LVLGTSKGYRIFLTSNLKPAHEETEEVKNLGEKYGVAYLNYKAPGGFLTNFDTFKARINSMNKMSSFLESEEFESLTKKEQSIYKRNLTRAKKVYE
jgi:ribosomal protein S2